MFELITSSHSFPCLHHFRKYFPSERASFLLYFGEINLEVYFPIYEYDLHILNHGGGALSVTRLSAEWQPTLDPRELAPSSTTNLTYGSWRLHTSSQIWIEVHIRRIPENSMLLTRGSKRKCLNVDRPKALMKRAKLKRVLSPDSNLSSQNHSVSCNQLVRAGMSTLQASSEGVSAPLTTNRLKLGPIRLSSQNFVNQVVAVRAIRPGPLLAVSDAARVWQRDHDWSCKLKHVSNFPNDPMALC